MTTDALLDELITREGGYVNNAVDKGGPTKYGITALTLGSWRRLGRWALPEEVEALTVDQAKEIYRGRYVQPFEKIPFQAIQSQLVDFGVNSGPETALKTLQQVLGVMADGIYGERTRVALVTFPWRLTNNALVAARVAYLIKLVDQDPSQKVFEHNWTRRALRFLS